MNLREFQAKRIFAANGIIVPMGKIASKASEVKTIATQLAAPVVLKPQLGIKKRGKLGLISFCDNSQLAEQEAARLLNTTFGKESVKTLLVEKKADVAEELYLSVTIDYSRRCPVIITSREGGIDIENLAQEAPEKLLTLPIDITDGPTETDIDAIAEFAGRDVAIVAEKLYSIFRKYDADLVEINPLVRTVKGTLVAVDAVLNISDDALFRQPEITELGKQIENPDPIVREATANNWTYIDLPGDIGILSSGAGLTMAILDLIHLGGGSAANFLDTAQIDDEGIYRAFALLAKAKPVNAMLINIFAGLNRCDKLAEGIVQYLKDRPYNKPIVVRMIGNKEEIGHRILRESGIEPYHSIEEAVERVIALSEKP